MARSEEEAWRSFWKFHKLEGRDPGTFLTTCSRMNGNNVTCLRHWVEGDAIALLTEAPDEKTLRARGLDAVEVAELLAAIAGCGAFMRARVDGKIASAGDFAAAHRGSPLRKVASSASADNTVAYMQDQCARDNFRRPRSILLNGDIDEPRVVLGKIAWRNWGRTKATDRRATDRTAVREQVSQSDGPPAAIGAERTGAAAWRTRGRSLPLPPDGPGRQWPAGSVGRIRAADDRHP